MLHVSRVPGLGGSTAGQSGADDASVARWCATTGHVLVTCDSDFSGRWVRSGLLAREGVETIVFAWQVRGLQEQHRQVTARYESWAYQLADLPADHRVWIQQKRGKLSILGS